MKRPSNRHPVCCAQPSFVQQASAEGSRSAVGTIPNPLPPGERPRIARLRAAAGSGPVLILTHDTPDPDALASGMALSRLLQAAWNIPSRLIYFGIIARAENRALRLLLTPEWEHAEELPRLEEYSAVALVDTQPTAGNNRLPAGWVPSIVVDHHHPVREALRSVPYVDVRPEIASTVTIVYHYLKAAGVVPDRTLATAMFYGLHADTRGLSRGASDLDEAVYVELLGHMDRALLIRVEEAGLPRVYFSALCQALHAARVYGHSVVADLGQMHRPDLMAEMADLLIRLEGARAALCLGRYEDTLHLSLRTVPLGRDAGLLIQEIVLPFGAGGGHGLMAGGQVALDGKEVDALIAEIERRFLSLMGVAEEGQSLLVEGT